MPTLARRLIAENKKSKATRPGLGNCGLFYRQYPISQTIGKLTGYLCQTRQN